MANKASGNVEMMQDKKVEIRSKKAEFDKTIRRPNVDKKEKYTSAREKKAWSNSISSIGDNNDREEGEILPVNRNLLSILETT